MASRRASLYQIPAAPPDDVSGAAALFEGGLNPKSVIAVLGKTEGNGCVNDFTSGFATASFERLFARHGLSGVPIVMSGGTEGALAPHWTIFAAEEVDAPPSHAMAIGVAHTPDLAPKHLGRREQIAMVAESVRCAMANAGIEEPAKTHFVQIKCSLLTSARVQEVAARGRSTAVADTLKSMGLSRGASALGVAAVLAKAEPDPSGRVRGRRHTMLDDSDISATRHARAFVGGVLAGLFGETEIYVSGGAEHQGPPGGGPVAMIVEREPAP